MALQPLSETDPIFHISGTDCTRISNAINSECSGQRCIVNKCKVGWVPNVTRDRCILDPAGRSKLRKVLKREDSLATNVAISADVSSDLAKIVDLVSGLDYLSLSQIPGGSSSSATIISDLLSGVRNATSTLIASTTIPSLLNNLDALLNVSSLLISTIRNRGFGTELDLTDLADALDNIIAVSLNLKSWSAHNVLTGFDLSHLLSGLSLNNSTVAVGAVVSSDLVAQIKSLVGLVISLVGVSSSLPPPSLGSGGDSTSLTGPSSINTNIINSIIDATADIINAPTVSSLLSSIGSLVNVNGLASGLLDHCGCVSSLGLGPLVASLAQVTSAALRLKDWCDTYPVSSIPHAPATGSSSTGASTLISNTDELPIDLGLFNLLGLLRPVESSVALSGLRTAANTLANGLLSGLGGGLLGTGNVSPVSAGGVLNPGLVTQLEGLVNLVIKLQLSYSPSGLTSFDASTLLDPNLVTNVVQRAANILGSPTADSLVTNIDALITANAALQTALMNCACADILGLNGVLVPVTNAALGLKNWCSSNSLIISQPVVSTSSPSLPPDTLVSIGGV